MNVRFGSLPAVQWDLAAPHLDVAVQEARTGQKRTLFVCIELPKGPAAALYHRQPRVAVQEVTQPLGLIYILLLNPASSAMRVKRAALRPDPPPNPATVTCIIKLAVVFADLITISHGIRNLQKYNLCSSPNPNRTSQRPSKH